MYRSGYKTTLTVSDARDILRMKYSQQKKRPIRPPMKHSIVQLNNSSNQNFKRFNNFTNHFTRNKGIVRNNRNTFNSSDKRQGMLRNISNKSPGFIVKRGNQGILRKTIRGSVPQDKQVFSNRNGITVVKKLSNTSNTRLTNVLNDDEDELEKMTLADLPDVRLPPGLLSVGTSTQFVTTASPSLPSPVTSRLTNDTMVADGVSSNQSSNRSILVSNLLPSVSEQDVVELFGSIGNLISVQPLRSGEMIVEFQSPIDAAVAVKRFHGLALDHQVMYCSPLPGRDTSLSSRLGDKTSDFTNVASPSSSIISSYIPQSSGRKNVKFIVQLP